MEGRSPCSTSPQATSCRLSHEQLGNTWSRVTRRRYSLFPIVRKIRSESAVCKTSTLSSEISSTAGHKTRDNEGKQPGWGGVSTSPPSLTFGTSISKGCEPLAGFTTPLVCSEIAPAHRGEHVVLEPSQPPAQRAAKCFYRFQCNHTLAHGSLCKISHVQGERAHCRDVILSVPLPPTAWGKWEPAVGQVTCTILN